MDVELCERVAKPSAQFLLQEGLCWLRLVYRLSWKFFDCQQVTGIDHDLLHERLETHLKVLLILFCTSKRSKVNRKHLRS